MSIALNTSITSFFIILVAFGSVILADFEDKTEADFIDASERCVLRERVPANLKPQLDHFQYPDTPVVHAYLHCVWTELGLWNDRSGFNVEHVTHLYKDKANQEVLIPILSNCNRNPERYPPLRWCYKVTVCILNSRVGQWFKDDIKKTIPNGHA